MNTTFLGMARAACHIVNHNRADQKEIMLSTVAEVGELTEEVRIAEGYRQGPPGKDGIVGESIDVIACALDMIFSELGDLDEEELTAVLRAKLQKWLSKSGYDPHLLPEIGSV